MVDPKQILTQVEPLTSVIDAYKAIACILLVENDAAPRLQALAQLSDSNSSATLPCRF